MVGPGLDEPSPGEPTLLAMPGEGSCRLAGQLARVPRIVVRQGGRGCDEQQFGPAQGLGARLSRCVGVGQGLRGQPRREQRPAAGFGQLGRDVPSLLEPRFCLVQQRQRPGQVTNGHRRLGAVDDCPGRFMTLADVGEDDVGSASRPLGQVRLAGHRTCPGQMG